MLSDYMHTTVSLVEHSVKCELFIERISKHQLLLKGNINGWHWMWPIAGVLKFWG